MRLPRHTTTFAASLFAALSCIALEDDDCPEARAALEEVWRSCECGETDGGDWGDTAGASDVSGSGCGCSVATEGMSCEEVYAALDSQPRCSCDGAGVGQGGAQDFGQFKQILEDGEIPGPETIDDLGFFGEHKIALDAPACGLDVCLHGELGVMGNMISGSNCTVIMLGMNTPIDPENLERPPLNLGLAIDISRSMRGDSLSYVREGLIRMLDALEPEDRVSLVTFSTTSSVETEFVDRYSQDLLLAISGLASTGNTNIYAGLDAAYQAVARHAAPDRQNRVILLSDGVANEGITDPDALIDMSESYNLAGLGLTTIGMGTEFNPDLMRELSEAGSGAFYFLQDPAAVQEVFEEEVQAFLVPLAQEVTIDVDIAAGYGLRGMYGTKLFEVSGGSGHIEIPVLQIAHRVSASDNEGGRRGGGGAIVVELTPDGEPPVTSSNEVGNVTMDYRIPGTDEITHQEAPITSPLGPGETPPNGHFTTSGVEKSFVMLNIYMGFEMAATQASVDDYEGALAVLLPMRDAVADWLADAPDPDIEDDLRYIDMFIQNLRAANTPEPEEPPSDPWPGD